MLGSAPQVLNTVFTHPGPTQKNGRRVLAGRHECRGADVPGKMACDTRPDYSRATARATSPSKLTASDAFVWTHTQPGPHAFAELSDTDGTRQQLAHLCGEMKAMKEAMEAQRALAAQLDAEKQRNGKLEEQVRELRVQNAKLLLEGKGGANLPGLDMDRLEDLPDTRSRSSRSSARSKDGVGALVQHHDGPMLYGASW